MRPAPKFLMSAPVGRTDRFVGQVVEGEGCVWFVVHGDTPVNVRQIDALGDSGLTKCRRTAFVCPGHAFNFAERRNRRHSLGVDHEPRLLIFGGEGRRVSDGWDGHLAKLERDHGIPCLVAERRPFRFCRP